MIPENIFHQIPNDLPEELCEVIQRGEGVRIERIVSRGQSFPKGFWYDQEDHEWVLVLKGSATLLFEGRQDPVALEPGDYLNIPAHTRHRVEWTDPGQETVWLAVHYNSTRGREVSL
ncbi:MAG: cupin domain-containing protein [Thermodesulfobacteriota bacterium]